MPGNPLSLLYPEVGDSTSAVLTKFSDNFQILQTDLEAKVNEADIQIGGPLSLRDYQLADVGTILMSEQSSVSAVEGTLTYGNGSWYVADAVGAIKLTDGAGGFNSAGFKGIGGDYGAGDPSEVTYDAAGGSYSFTDDPGVFADIKVEKVLLQRAAGSLSVSADPAITGAQAITVGAPPGAGTAVWTITSAGVVAPGAAVTVAQTFGALTAASLTVASLTDTAVRTKSISLVDLEWTNAAATVTRALNRVTTITASTEFVIPIDLDVGEKLLDITCHITRSANVGSVSLRAYKCDTAGTITYLGAAVTSAATSSSFPLSFPYAGAACAAGETFGAYLELPTNGDYVSAITYTRQGT